MNLIETLLLGSYLYTTAVFIWFTKWERQRVTNHLEHLALEMKLIIATAVQAALDAKLLTQRVSDLEAPSDTPPPPPHQSTSESSP